MPITDLGSTADPLGNPAKKSPISDKRLFEVAREFYEHMAANSEFHDLDLMWEGSMSQWFKENRLTHLYSPVTKLLYKAGCCNLVSRGGGTKPSLVKLNHAPTLKEISTLREGDFFFERDTMTRKGRELRLEQMVNDHRGQIASLLERVERLEKKIV